MLPIEIGIDPQIPFENRRPEARVGNHHRDPVEESIESLTNIFRRISLEIPRPVVVTDALTYLDAIQDELSDQPDRYNNFLDIMAEFKSNQCVLTLYSFLDTGPIYTELTPSK